MEKREEEGRKGEMRKKRRYETERSMRGSEGGKEEGDRAVGRVRRRGIKEGEGREGGRRKETGRKG